jgi:hypothetical protein
VIPGLNRVRFRIVVPAVLTLNPVLLAGPAGHHSGQRVLVAARIQDRTPEASAIATNTTRPAVSTVLRMWIF